MFYVLINITEMKTPVPPNAGNEIQSCVDVKLYKLGRKFIKYFSKKA